jgi:hypothetical protein
VLRPRSSACSPGSEDSTSPPKPSGIPAPRRSSGTPTAPASSSDTGPTYPDGGTSTTSPLLPTPTANDSSASGHRQAERSEASHDGMTLSDWATSPWASSSEDSPASPSAPQADARQATTPAGSGPSSPVLLASYDRERSSSRTSEVSYRLVTWTQPQASLFGDLPSERFSETWPTSGMTRHGRCFALPMSVPAISEPASSSLLPTPETGTTPNGHGRRGGRPGNGRQSGANLDALLATPTTGDTTPHYDLRISPGQKPRERPVPNLAAQVEDELLPRSTELPDVLASLGEPTNPPSDGGKP